jgi:hypothetical protein
LLPEPRLEFLGVREIRKVLNEPPLDMTEDRPAHRTELTCSTFEVPDYKTARRLAQGEPVAVTYASTADCVIDPNEDPSERAERFNKRTESRGPLVSVGLYLHGPELDPDQITRILNTRPNHQHRKNDTYVSASGRVVTRKGGLWRILVKIDSPEVNDHLRVLAEHLEPLLKVLREQDLSLERLPNVEDAYVDIFRVETCMWEQAFTLSWENARLLAELRLPIKFAIAY